MYTEVLGGSWGKLELRRPTIGGGTGRGIVFYRLQVGYVRTCVGGRPNSSSLRVSDFFSQQRSERVSIGYMYNILLREGMSQFGPRYGTKVASPPECRHLVLPVAPSNCGTTPTVINI